MYNEIVYSSIPNLPVHISCNDRATVGVACANHYHDEIELLKITRGRFACITNEKTHILSEGDIAFINSCVPHYTTVLENDTATVLVQINTDAFVSSYEHNYLSKFINNGEQQFVLFKKDGEDTKKLIEYIDALKMEYIEKKEAYETYIKAYIYSIIALLYRERVLINIESFFDVKAIDKIMPVLHYVHSNYHKPIKLEELSSILNLNHSYFCRLFKKLTNSTFTNYLNFVRICNAERLLSSTKKTILEISLETGFSSVSYFNRTFKRFKNCAPTAYRKIKYAQN